MVMGLWKWKWKSLHCIWLFETPLTYTPDAKNWLIGKHPDAGKDWRREEKGTTEDDMVGWDHHLNEHEFEQAPGDGEGQWSLACCSPWGCKELDTTERLNNNEQFKTRPLLELRFGCRQRKGVSNGVGWLQSRSYAFFRSRSVSSATFLAGLSENKTVLQYWKIPAEWVPINNHTSPKVNE